MINFFKEDEKHQYGYVESIKVISSLSRLFSDSDTPFLHYRVMENVFCSSFNAINLSRSDTAYDAKIKNIGVGLKTFICHQNGSVEKIAEFNKMASTIKNKTDKRDLAEFLGKCRNDRIEVANRTYGVEVPLYHIIARKHKELVFFETNYNQINIANIQEIEHTGKSLKFNDGEGEYYFNFSKSVLQKKFYIPENCSRIGIDIIENPFDILASLKDKIIKGNHAKKNIAGVDYLILPLFSLKGEKHVPKKSQLNQWNAGGRIRSFDEVYIPVPKTIHKLFPNFFPPRDEPFVIETPLREVLNAKICQDGGKALMTNPNSALSNWLLRRVLKLKQGELLTLEKLESAGVDSVVISKKNNIYTIDIMPLGRYEDFIEGLGSAY